MIRQSLLSLALLCAICLPASAAEPAFPTASLSAYASQKVPTDEMLVTFFVERDGTNLGAVNQQVLRELQGALTDAKRVKGVNAKLGSVWTSQTWSPQGKPNGWKVRGEVVLDSAQLKDLGDLTGQLSQRLGFGSVAFRLSESKRLAVQNQLITEASTAFRAKAKVTATALGYSTYELKEVAVSESSSSGAPPPMTKMMRMAASAENVGLPPDGGNAEVTVTLSGSVLLK